MHDVLVYNIYETIKSNKNKKKRNALTAPNNSTQQSVQLNENIQMTKCEKLHK